MILLKYRYETFNTLFGAFSVFCTYAVTSTHILLFFIPKFTRKFRSSVKIITKPLW